MNFDKKLLENIVCPLSKEKLFYDEESNSLIARNSKLSYPIRDGIPIMLIEEAKKLINFYSWSQKTQGYSLFLLVYLLKIR